MNSMFASLQANVFCSPQCSQQCGNKGGKSSVRKLTNAQPYFGDEDDEELTINPHALGLAGRGQHLGSVQDDAAAIAAEQNWKENCIQVEKARTQAAPRVFRAPVAPPQDLHFVVPPLNEQQEGPGRGVVCVHGPHGPIMVELPADAEPGQQRTWRLGPVGKQVVCPDDACEGSEIDVDIDGTMIKAKVPAGKKPGDFFEVVPPALVVMIPQKVEDGDFLEFIGLNGENCKVPAPIGLKPGQYFSLLL